MTGHPQIVCSMRKTQHNTDQLTNGGGGPEGANHQETGENGEQEQDVA